MTSHIPVLLSQVLAHAKDAKRPLVWGLDVTWGRGGHSRELMDKHPNLHMIGLDRDRAAVDFAEREFGPSLQSGRLTVLHANYHELLALWHSKLERLTAGDRFDLIIADLGVSSPQLDEPARGFSFYHEGPLDMRMDQRQDIDAAGIINTWGERDLVELFREWGEVRSPQRVVRAIVHDRKSQPFQTTLDLAGLIERVDGWRKKGQHPATKYFLALRLAVNDELTGLRSSIDAMMDLLSPGGRLLVITFHSLEDRIVKHAMKDRLTYGTMVNKKVIIADELECQQNPRARSAKLRVFERQVAHERV